MSSSLRLYSSFWSWCVNSPRTTACLQCHVPVFGWENHSSSSSLAPDLAPPHLNLVLNCKFACKMATWSSTRCGWCSCLRFVLLSQLLRTLLLSHSQGAAGTEKSMLLSLSQDDSYNDVLENTTDYLVHAKRPPTSAPRPEHPEWSSGVGANN